VTALLYVLLACYLACCTVTIIAGGYDSAPAMTVGGLSAFLFALAVVRAATK
jgi:hypothetical protein